MSPSRGADTLAALPWSSTPSLALSHPTPAPEPIPAPSTPIMLYIGAGYDLSPLLTFAPGGSPYPIVPLSEQSTTEPPLCTPASHRSISPYVYPPHDTYTSFLFVDAKPRHTSAFMVPDFDEWTTVEARVKNIIRYAQGKLSRWRAIPGAPDLLWFEGGGDDAWVQARKNLNEGWVFVDESAPTITPSQPVTTLLYIFNTLDIELARAPLMKNVWPCVEALYVHGLRVHVRTGEGIEIDGEDLFPELKRCYVIVGSWGTPVRQNGKVSVGLRHVGFIRRARERAKQNSVEQHSLNEREEPGGSMLDTPNWKDMNPGRERKRDPKRRPIIPYFINTTAMKSKLRSKGVPSAHPPPSLAITSTPARPPPSHACPHSDFHIHPRHIHPCPYPFSSFASTSSSDSESELLPASPLIFRRPHPRLCYCTRSKPHRSVPFVRSLPVTRSDSEYECMGRLERHVDDWDRMSWSSDPDLDAMSTAYATDDSSLCEGCGWDKNRGRDRREGECSAFGWDEPVASVERVRALAGAFSARGGGEVAGMSTPGISMTSVSADVTDESASPSYSVSSSQPSSPPSSPSPSPFSSSSASASTPSTSPPSPLGAASCIRTALSPLPGHKPLPTSTRRSAVPPPFRTRIPQVAWSDALRGGQGGYFVEKTVQESLEVWRAREREGSEGDESAGDEGKERKKRKKRKVVFWRDKGIYTPHAETVSQLFHAPLRLRLTPRPPTPAFVPETDSFFSPEEDEGPTTTTSTDNPTGQAEYIRTSEAHADVRKISVGGGERARGGQRKGTLGFHRVSMSLFGMSRCTGSKDASTMEKVKLRAREKERQIDITDFLSTTSFAPVDHVHSLFSDDDAFTSTDYSGFSTSHPPSPSHMLPSPISFPRSPYGPSDLGEETRSCPSIGVKHVRARKEYPVRSIPGFLGWKMTRTPPRSSLPTRPQASTDVVRSTSASSRATQRSTQLSSPRRFLSDPGGPPSVPSPPSHISSAPVDTRLSSYPSIRSPALRQQDAF